MVNELHVSYTRNNTDLGQPVGGTGVSLTSQGFENPDGSPSIVALDPKGQSVENLNFNGYSTGAAANQLTQVNNTYQVTDAVSKVLGSHTMKYGAEFHADQVNAHPIAQFNGSFVFSGTETGVDFAKLYYRRAQPIQSKPTQSLLCPEQIRLHCSRRIAGTFSLTSR